MDAAAFNLFVVLGRMASTTALPWREHTGAIITARHYDIFAAALLFVASATHLAAEERSVTGWTMTSFVVRRFYIV